MPLGTEDERMIAKLRGFVDTIGEDYCIIDVNGVGYLVFVSAKTAARLSVGSEASLLIETVVREDSITLFGFADALEKEWFNTLTKVQGVGAKVCLSILSALSPMQLAQAVSAQDKASFTRANGVGPKLAARIVTELKDKVVMVPVAEFAKEVNMNLTPAEQTENYEDSLMSRAEDPSKMEDAISALVNLGYQRLEAYRAVNNALNAHPNADMSELIRESLKEFVIIKKCFIYCPIPRALPPRPDGYLPYPPSALRPPALFLYVPDIRCFPPGRESAKTQRRAPNSRRQRQIQQSRAGRPCAPARRAQRLSCRHVLCRPQIAALQDIRKRRCPTESNAAPAK